MPQVPEDGLRFGPFKLFREKRLLLENDQPVRLGGRALDILIALVDRAGETLSKNELIRLVWPQAIVDESVLRVHVAALRKVLGSSPTGGRYIVNIPGRGYSFVAPITRAEKDQITTARASAHSHSDRIPARLTRVIGRGDAVAMLAAQLQRRRFVTLVGPGGIGKTTVAAAVAEEAGRSCEDGAYFADLSPVSGDAVAQKVATALGLSDVSEESGRKIAEFLRPKNLLLILDNCEHVLSAVVPLAEYLLRSVPGLRVLATSREPLRAEGEWLHHLPALRIPPTHAKLNPSQAEAYSAYTLFVERATAAFDGFECSSEDVPIISDICRRLDGNPLAIELAAARIDLLGLRGLSRQLNSQILQLKQVRRTALGRHQTLDTVLAWSYRLLTDDEQLIFRCLAIFNGRFTFEAANALLGASEVSAVVNPSEALNYIVELTAKSLLTSDASGEIVYYRLLELTRAFALTKLAESGQYALIAAQHARYIYGLMRQAGDDWTAMDRGDWQIKYRWCADEIRAAMSWCFSPQGDPLLGASMTVVAPVLGQFLGLLDDPSLIERALNVLTQLPGVHPELEMRLKAASGFVLQERQGSDAAVEAARSRAMELAAQMGDAKMQAEVLMSVVMGHATRGHYTVAAATAKQLQDVARKSGDPTTIAVADRICAQQTHYAGWHQKAKLLAEQVLNHPVKRGSLSTIAAGIDHAVSMRITISRILWLQGFADQALALARETLKRASQESTLAHIQAFAVSACPIALWRGDMELAQQWIDEYVTVTERHLSHQLWLPLVTIPWQLALQVPGNSKSPFDWPTIPMYVLHLSTVCGGFVTLELMESSGENWCSAEILRAYGEQLVQRGSASEKEEAQAIFERCVVISRAQGALAWELRATMSLARLWRDFGRISDALNALEAIYRRFEEGFETVDLMNAASLIQALAATAARRDSDENPKRTT